MKHKSLGSIIIFLIGLVHGLKFIPERANVTFSSSKYVSDARIYITRFGRRSPYYMNFEGTVLHSWTNNVTLNFVFYEYLHNEYKRSFVEMHYKFCDMIRSEPYVGRMLAAFGVKCPAEVKTYHLVNMTIPVENFPGSWPFQKGRIDAEVMLTRTKEVFLRAYFYATFKDDTKQTKKPNI